MDMHMDMDMGSSTTAMATATATSAAASSTSTMSMSMGSSSSCKISMLWNWTTLDACFLSSSWHVTSHGMFAGSCLGVVALVVALEFLRRAQREFDRYVLRSRAVAHCSAACASGDSGTASPGEGEPGQKGVTRTAAFAFMGKRVGSVGPVGPVRPTLVQHAVRSLIHMLQFAVAYFIMLLAMYYNGYIIICIFIGAYLGAFIFSWDTLATGPAQEVSGCCG